MHTIYIYTHMHNIYICIYAYHLCIRISAPAFWSTICFVPCTSLAPQTPGPAPCPRCCSPPPAPWTSPPGAPGAARSPRPRPRGPARPAQRAREAKKVWGRAVPVVPVFLLGGGPQNSGGEKTIHELLVLGEKTKIIVLGFLSSKS